MYAFDYTRPSNLADALAALTQSESRPLAGGMTLLPTLKLRLARPSVLVDLDGVAELKGIAVEGDRIRIGAMTRHAEVASSAAVRAVVPALARLAALIGDPQVRHRGTIGGSIVNHDPAADYPAALLGLGATIHTTAGAIPADDFFTGLFSTTLAEGQLVTSVEIARPEAAGYSKFAHPASRFALVGVFVARTRGAVRVAVTGAGPGVFRSAELERALATRFTPEQAEGVRVPSATLNDDIHGSAAYRAHLVPVIAARSVADALGDRA